MPARKFDRRTDSSIVKPSDKETPPEGASNTIQGLTGHADTSSMAAESYSNVALSSRQLLKPAPLAKSAVGDFSIGQIEYCEPSLEELNDFARDVLSKLSNESSGYGTDTITRQSFRQFLSVVVTMMTKEANREPQ